MNRISKTPGRRAWRLAIAAAPSIILAIVPAFFLSCASNVGGTGRTTPSISVVDFRAQQVERIRDGVIGMAGDDSAGTAAKTYIKAFEEDLATRIPRQTEMPAPVDEDPRMDRWYDVFPYRPPVNQLQQQIESRKADPKLLELKRYLDGRKAAAIGDLRCHHASFTSGGGTADAILGLAAAYVAISCANEPGEVETIAKLVGPLLTELNTR